MTSNRIPRRRFLQSLTSAAGVLSAPYFVPSSAFGANERIVTGHVGVGNQGRANLSRFMAQKSAQIAAVCDVDTRHLSQAATIVEQKYGQCITTGDYRRLLERKDLDAIVISTPDHWHALIAIDACQAGKDVYVEKPLSLTISEGRAMVLAARANHRIVQTGSQQRSWSEFRQACELVRNRAIGKLQRVLVGIPKPNHPGEPIPDSDPAAELDYEMWTGSAPLRPYNANRVHYNFRFFRDYSGGQMTNFGAHHIDIAQWGMGTDHTGPLKTSGTGTWHLQRWHEVTESCRIDHTYASGVVLTVGQQQNDIPTGTTFIGDQGSLFVTRGKLITTPTERLASATASIAASDSVVKLYDSRDHAGNFLDCIKSRELPVCDVEIGHRTATICHLGNIALELGRPLDWNPDVEDFNNDDEASSLRSRPRRTPWKLPVASEVTPQS